MTHCLEGIRVAVTDRGAACRFLPGLMDVFLSGFARRSLAFTAERRWKLLGSSESEDENYRIPASTDSAPEGRRNHAPPGLENQ